MTKKLSAETARTVAEAIKDGFPKLMGRLKSYDKVNVLSEGIDPKLYDFIEKEEFKPKPISSENVLPKSMIQERIVPADVRTVRFPRGSTGVIMPSIPPTRIYEIRGMNNTPWVCPHCGKEIEAVSDEFAAFGWKLSIPDNCENKVRCAGEMLVQISIWESNQKEIEEKKS